MKPILSFLFALLAAAPFVAAQNVKVDAGAVNPSGTIGVVGSGAGTVGTGTSLPTGANAQIHTGPALPSVSATVPTVRTTHGGASAAVDIAQPAASFQSPAAVRQGVSRSVADPASARPQALSPGTVAGEASALPQRTPGAETSPVLRPETPGPGGASAGAVQDFQKARERERKGAGGQVDGALNTLFDASKTRAAGRETAPSNGAASRETRPAAAAEILPDPRALGPEKALEKVRSLAAGASPADAPRLYEHAVSIAKEMPARAGTTVKRILSDAAVRAPKAVPELAGDALRSAAENRRAETERYTKALDGWNGLLSTPGKQYIVNLDEFRAVVEGVRAQAEAAKGRRLPTPKALADRVGGREGQLRLKVKLDAELASDVPMVPQALALSMALPELRAVAAWELPSAEAQLRDAFGLSPRASPAGFYRAARAEGRSVLASFWLASRRWLSSRALALTERLRLLVLRLLQRFGFVQGLEQPAFTVDVSDAALAPLRALPARALREPAGPQLQPDPLRLGYRIHPGPSAK